MFNFGRFLPRDGIVCSPCLKGHPFRAIWTKAALYLVGAAKSCDECGRPV